MIVVKDNFCEDVKELRKLALSQDYIMHRYFPGGSVAWRGFRTWELTYLNNPLIQKYAEKILNLAYETYNLKDQALHKFFHISYEEHKQNRIREWHTDPTSHAGVLYLTPNPSSESGTTIFLDGKRNDIKNKYNRLVMYPGKNKHGISSFFGDSKESGRMTFTFFISDREKFKRDLSELNKLRERHDHGYSNRYLKF